MWENKKIIVWETGDITYDSANNTEKVNKHGSENVIWKCAMNLINRILEPFEEPLSTQ